MKNSNQSLTSKAIRAMVVLTMLIIALGVSTLALGIYTAHADGNISDMGGDAGTINNMGGDAGTINNMGGDAGAGINNLGGDAGVGINDMGGDAGTINDMGGDAGQPQEGVTISSLVIVPTPPIITPPILTPPTTPGCTTNCNTTPVITPPILTPPTTPGCTTNCNTTPGCTQNCNTGCTTNCGSTPGCTSDCGGGWSPPPIYLAAVPITSPSPFIYLNQVPYTGVGDDLLAAIYLLALALLSAGAAYLVAYRQKVEIFMEKRRPAKPILVIAPVKIAAAPVARPKISSPYQAMPARASRYVFSSATMSWMLA